MKRLTGLAILLLVTLAHAQPGKDPVQQPEYWTKLAAKELEQIADAKTCWQAATSMVSMESAKANDETRPVLIEALELAREKLARVPPDEKGLERRDALVRIAEQFARLKDDTGADETLVLADKYNDALPATTPKSAYQAQSDGISACIGSMEYGLDRLAKLPEADRNSGYWTIMQLLHATGGDMAVSEKVWGRITPNTWLKGFSRQALIREYAARGNYAEAERLVAATELENRADAMVWLSIGQSIRKDWDAYAKTLDRLPPTKQATQWPHLARHYWLTGKKDAANDLMVKARIISAGLRPTEQRQAINVLIDYDCLSGDFKDALEWWEKIPNDDLAKPNRRNQIARAQAIAGDTAPAKELLSKAATPFQRLALLASLAGAGGAEADDYRKQARTEVAKLLSAAERPYGVSMEMELLVEAGQLDTLGDWIKTLPDPASRRMAYSGVAFSLRKQQEYLEK